VPGAPETSGIAPGANGSLGSGGGPTFRVREEPAKTSTGGGITSAACRSTSSSDWAKTGLCPAKPAAVRMNTKTINKLVTIALFFIGDPPVLLIELVHEKLAWIWISSWLLFSFLAMMSIS
jgi:hypothetical protein